jgi:malate dehydrogenase (oxaloacetate-decarboxylating)
MPDPAGPGGERPLSEAMRHRQQYAGLIGVASKMRITDASVLSTIYTPGVAQPCLDIQKSPVESFAQTMRGNTVAIVSDGSAAFGLGMVGPEAILPVMEGKSVVFKTFAGVDALPICLSTHDISEIVETVIGLAPTFGGICLEDIVAPACLTIGEELQRAMNIPVINNHREAVAVGVLAGVLNALKIVDKKAEAVKVVINGSGAAGIGTAEMLLRIGVRNIIVCDRHGALSPYRPQTMHWAKWELAKKTNPDRMRGDLATVITGADLFIGFSVGDVVTPEMIRSMAIRPIVFAFAGPVPEIEPAAAYAAGAAVVATAQSQYANQMDIASVFPGLFRGLLDVRARRVNDQMLLAAAEALAALVSEDELSHNYIVPKVLDFRAAPAIAQAVAAAAIGTGVAKVATDPEWIAERTRHFIREGRFPVPEPSVDDTASYAEQSVDLHRRYQGVLEIKSKVPITDDHILSLFYLPPGAVEPAERIAQHPDWVYDYTIKRNLVAIVSDGSAVLGLGNIGARAAMPVMEGKSVLFHTFAGVEAFPICIATQDPDEIVAIVKRLEPTFGGVNLEDISAPRCFHIEERLKRETSIPIFHDDQHGTAVVVLAGVMNACRVTGRALRDLAIVVNGAGASAIAVSKLLISVGVGDVVLCDTTGTIYRGRAKGMNPIKEEMAAITNRGDVRGTLADAMRGRDLFIGLSAAGAATADMVRNMNPHPMVFALANPTPEIFPDEAKGAGAAICATGRSDLPNQVNNSLAFPGIFRGALDTRARQITDPMKIAAAHAIAASVTEAQLGPDFIIPGAMDFSVAPRVAMAVARVAMESGEARQTVELAVVAARCHGFAYEGGRRAAEGGDTPDAPGPGVR